MFQRLLRRSNYIMNNYNFSFQNQEFTAFLKERIVDKSKTESNKKSHPTISVEIDKDWKIKEMVKKELEKEGVVSNKPEWAFSGLVGILFFIVVLYEQRII